MLRRLWRRFCPHCLHDERPLTQHPALESMERTAIRLERMHDLIRAEMPLMRPSGNVLRDLTVGAYGERHGD